MPTPDEYFVSTDPAFLDVTAIHAYLARSYWAEGIPFTVVERSLAHSLCFGLYHRRPGVSKPDQVGLARVVTDRATYAYLCDVYVLEDHRAKGLSTLLMREVMQHPELQGLRRFGLFTRDAHGLYARFGFTPLPSPERAMERIDRDVYKRMTRGG